MNKILGLFVLISGLVTAQAFNIEVTIPDTYHSVVSGDNLWFTTKVVNLGNDERMDISLIYEILDSEGKQIAMKSETVAIETQASFVGNIRVPESLEKGVYVLKVTLNSSLGESVSESTFDVIDEKTPSQWVIKFSLFDILVEIPDKYKVISPGDQLLTSIKLVNVGSSGRIDVFLNYKITGPDDDVILTKRETVAVETQANFVRTFDIPGDTPSGKYKISAEIEYADGKYAVSEHDFNVVGDKSYKNWYYAIGVLALVALIIIPIVRHPPEFETMRIKRKVSQIVRKRMKETKNEN